MKYLKDSLEFVAMIVVVVGGFFLAVKGPGLFDDPLTFPINILFSWGAYLATYFFVFLLLFNRDVPRDELHTLWLEKLSKNGIHMSRASFGQKRFMFALANWFTILLLTAFAFILPIGDVTRAWLIGLSWLFAFIVYLVGGVEKKLFVSGDLEKKVRVRNQLEKLAEEFFCENGRLPEIAELRSLARGSGIKDFYIEQAGKEDQIEAMIASLTDLHCYVLDEDGSVEFAPSR